MVLARNLPFRLALLCVIRLLALTQRSLLCAQQLGILAGVGLLEVGFALILGMGRLVVLCAQIGESHLWVGILDREGSAVFWLFWHFGRVVLGDPAPQPLRIKWLRDFGPGGREPAFLEI